MTDDMQSLQQRKTHKKLPRIYELDEDEMQTSFNEKIQKY
jgi:hypothetical protein